MIENEYVFTIILTASIIGIFGSLIRIFSPNYVLRKYISGDWKINDNGTRFFGLVFFLIYVYVILYLLEYIK